MITFGMTNTKVLYTKTYSNESNKFVYIYDLRKIKEIQIREDIKELLKNG